MTLQTLCLTVYYRDCSEAFMVQTRHLGSKRKALTAELASKKIHIVSKEKIYLSSLWFCLMLYLYKPIVLPLHPNILPNVHSSFHKHSSLFLDLLNTPTGTAADHDTHQRKNKMVWKFISSANTQDGIGFISLFLGCFFPRKASQMFPHSTRIMLLIHQHPFTPVCLLPPVVPLWVHANKPSRYPGLWYISSFLCGCVPPGQSAVLTGNRWAMQKFESAQVILFYDLLCNLAFIFTSFSNFQRLQSWFYNVCILPLYSAVQFSLTGRKAYSWISLDLAKSLSREFMLALLWMLGTQIILNLIKIVYNTKLASHIP